MVRSGLARTLALLGCLLLCGGPLDVVRCQSEEAQGLSLSLVGRCTCCDGKDATDQCTAHQSGQPCQESAGAAGACSGCQDQVIDQYSPTFAAHVVLALPACAAAPVVIPSRIATAGNLSQLLMAAQFRDTGPPVRLILRI